MGSVLGVRLAAWLILVSAALSLRQTHHVPDIRVKTIALGYSRAYGRLQKAYEPAFSRRVLIDSYAAEHTAEQIWVALFEALNWLDALCLHPEAAPRIDPKLKDALRFVRGRVHHAFGDAIEFRDDVPLPLGPVGVGLGSKRPVLITDWCWSDAADLPGGKRASSAASRDRSGETATKRFWLVCRSARPSIRSRSLPQKFTFRPRRPPRFGVQTWPKRLEIASGSDAARIPDASQICLHIGHFGPLDAKRRLPAEDVWGQEVSGSNPGAPTEEKARICRTFARATEEIFSGVR
jgi:hypothetical protein